MTDEIEIDPLPSTKPIPEPEPKLEVGKKKITQETRMKILKVSAVLPDKFVFFLVPILSLRDWQRLKPEHMISQKL